MGKKVVLSGYYGADNFGDEAILNTLVNRLKKNNAEIVVLSSNPDKTMLTHKKLRAINKFSYFNVIKEILSCDVLISGGGSLLQDVTSLKSLFYYLWVIFVAQLFGKSVIIFAQGIGPIKNKLAQILTKKLLKNCKWVSVRDDKSLFLLRGWKIQVEKVCDPIYEIELPQHSPKNILGVQLRSFKTVSEKLLLTLASRIAVDFADKEIEIYSFQDSNDLEICQHFESLLLSINSELKTSVIQGLNVKEIVNRMANLDYLIAMRFHAVLVALKYGIKTLAINYDYKVENLANESNIPSLSMSANEDYGYMFKLLKNENRTKLLEYSNSKHFDWEKFDLLVQ
ncbi:polysaccharide pyruvyl transferase CsaB [bacterium]|nr:polysaccharide pyruvyl transferase CsaB [bacterium]